MHPVEQFQTHLGRYELIARLASGGMGEIFLARLEGAAGFEKLYAVKRILPHLADDMRFRAMLIDEAQIASKLSHPNICQVYELGEADGELYIAMEYLDGITLLPILRQAAQKEQPLELGLVACVIQQIAEALHYAHELRDRNGTPFNVVHRDVTPSNIFVTESGVTKVLDFGIAKARNVSSNTQTGTIKGKHAYMAPEQLRGAPLDRRVDIFAVGVLLYEMLALRRLFQRRTDYLTLQAVMEDPIPDVRRFRNDLPDALVAALGKALQRDRDLRFETVRQLGTAVVDAIASQQRVWTASNLGDQLAMRFGTELRRRNTAVLAAVSRPSGEGGVLLSLDELEVHARQTSTDGTGVDVEYHGGDRAATYADDDNGDLPSLGSALNELMGEVPTAMERGTPSGPVLYAPGRSAEMLAQLPPGERSSEMMAAQAPGYGPRSAELLAQLPGRESRQLSEARPRRTWPWVLFAVALLGIAGAALVIVWRSSQRQQQQQVVLITEPSGGARVGETGVRPAGGETEGSGGGEAVGSGGSGGSGGEAVGSGGSGGSDGSGKTAKPPGEDGDGGGSGSGGGKRDSKTVLRAKIAALRPKIASCLGKPSGAQTGDVEGTVVLQIDKRGQVSSVEIRPAALAGTPLATCIKSTFSAQRFPEQRETLEITVPFSTKLRPAL